MFGYKARIEELHGKAYWMIYSCQFWICTFIERCNDEATCIRRLSELRSANQGKWLGL